jgi:hypothetical protein
MRFPRAVRCLAATILLAASHQGQQKPAYVSKEEKLPKIVAPQPVPFSHKAHAAARLACRDCHGGAYQGDRAGFPDAKVCLACHRTIAAGSPAIQKLREWHERRTEIEWVRVYRAPDYVFFSHAPHVGAKVACETCHGPVREREVLAKEVSTSMTSCMNCHAKTGAPVDCRSCHELGR